MAVLKYSKNRQKWFRLKHHYADVLEKKDYTREARTIRTCHEVSHLAGCKDCQGTRYILHKCGHRLCPICSYHVSRLRADFLRKISAELSHPKLITLTIPTQGDDYEKGFKLIVGAFRKLRKDRLFRAIKGGAYSYEVVPHESYYHIHLHLLVDAPFIPQTILFAAWRRIIGVSYASVDIKAATSDAAREYITKYAAKNHAISTDPDLIWKLYAAIKGRRLFGTFGSWYNATMDDDPTKDEHAPKPGVCPCCGSTTGFFWIRHGGFVFGRDAWRDFESAYMRGRPEVETHEIIWEETIDEKKNTINTGNATGHPAESDYRNPAMADAFARAGSFSEKISADYVACKI